MVDGFSNGGMENAFAARIVKMVRARLIGEPEILAADLATLRPEYPSDLSKTTIGDPTMGGSQRALDLQRQLWADEAEMGRVARYREYAAMYDTVPELKRILKVVVSMVFGGDPASGEALAAANRAPFEVVFGNGISPETRQVVEEAIITLSLPVLIPQMFAAGLRYGDNFLELVASLTAVVGRREHRPGDVRMIPDGLGGVREYRVVIGESTFNAAMLGNPGGSGRVVSPLFMVHYAHERQYGHRYGESLYHSLISAERQFTSTNDVLHVLAVAQGAQRKTVLYQVPRTAPALAIKKLIAELKSFFQDVHFFDGDGTLNRKIASILDYTDKFIPYREGQEKPSIHNEPSPPFDALLNVIHFDQGRFYLGTGVPKALAGLLDDAHSRAALSEQGMHFAKALRFWQQDVANILMDILVRVMLIADVPFAPGDVLIRMNTLSEFNEKLTAEVVKLRAEAAATLKSADVPMRWILEQVLRVPQHLIDPLMLQIDVGAEADPDVEPGAPIPPENEAARARAAYGEEAARRLKEWAEILERVTGTLDKACQRLQQTAPGLWSAETAP